MIPRTLVVWLAIAAAETVNGTVREMFLVPAYGTQAGHRISFGIAVMLIAAIIYSSIGWLAPVSVSQALLIGIMLTVLMFGFEIAIGLAFGVSWDRITADYDPRRGGPMLFGMAFLVAAPAIAHRLRLSGPQARSAEPPR